MTKTLILSLGLLLLLGPLLAAQQIYNYYDPGDWVSFTNTRYVTAIARGFNTVYFATTDGILRYDTVRDRWLDPMTTSDGMPENRIRRLAVDRFSDEVWIETPSYTAYYNPTFAEWFLGEPFAAHKVQVSNFSPSQFPQMFVDRGFNWLPGGLLVGHDMLEYQITQTLEDDVGITWVGVWGYGPGKGDLRRNSLELLPYGPYDSDVAALTIDGDDIWFLGGGDGMPGVISRFERRADRWEYFQPRLDPRIVSDQFYAVEHDSSNIWIGTELGLVRFDKRRQSFSSYTRSDGIYGERVTAILAAPGNIIIGTDQGVSVFDLKKDSVYAATGDNIRGLNINDLLLHRRTIYAATDRGIFTLKWGGSQWERLTVANPLFGFDVYQLAVLDSFLIAVGEDGVVQIDLNSNDYSYYDRNTTFKNADLRVLLVHEGIIWVGGRDGLFRLNKRTDNWYHYRPEDGLIGYRVTSLAGDGEQVWIGTDRGVSRFRWDDQSRSDWKQ